MSEKNQEIREMLLDLGADVIGFGDVENHLPASLRDMPRAISYAVRLSSRIIEEIDPAVGPSQTYFHHYRTVNTLIDQISLKTMLKIQQMGYSAYAIPASQSINEKPPQYRGRISHRMAATRSGLGWIGKSGNLITEAFGPEVRLGTVLTSLPLTVHSPIEISRCGSCNICVKACPGYALPGNHEWKPGIERELIVDPVRCSQHMKKAYQHIGRGAVCGICMRVCPYGKAKKR
ncbi:Epoxyqueuosine reductase QueG (queuosine biosynthesis) [Tindallia magadiensis]|uniref:Epoxyqueuosine reductase QueG (Queuosine biosynthesis) n=1 Tax=Tindallia magadiensis TaxID=69895 RepID=A0A1I3FU55_9FIRM|nr:4Fe-4S double cluster binding domain-containing protein [Tindallia magadiensis]SFI14687.1 Epoxyqueuosine reductase QueG (queuosine biosynthesis) [Tindallia magadiensis]